MAPNIDPTLTPEQAAIFERVLGVPVRTTNDVFFAAEHLRQAIEPAEPVKPEKVKP